MHAKVVSSNKLQFHSQIFHAVSKFSQYFTASRFVPEPTNVSQCITELLFYPIHFLVGLVDWLVGLKAKIVRTSFPPIDILFVAAHSF